MLEPTLTLNQLGETVQEDIRRYNIWTTRPNTYNNDSSKTADEVAV